MLIWACFSSVMLCNLAYYWLVKCDKETCHEEGCFLAHTQCSLHHNYTSNIIWQFNFPCNILKQIKLVNVSAKKRIVWSFLFSFPNFHFSHLYHISDVQIMWVGISWYPKKWNTLYTVLKEFKSWLFNKQTEYTIIILSKLIQVQWYRFSLLYSSYWWGMLRS